jgi:hypothetical protein
MGEAAGGKRDLEAGTQNRDAEIKEAENRGFIRGLRAVGNLCKSPSLFPANVFLVQGYPNVPPIVHRMIDNFAPPIPFPPGPAPLNLPEDYADFPRYFRELDARSILFVLGKYAGKDVHVKLDLAIDLDDDENDPETPRQVGSSVYLHHLAATLPGLIIGHIVGTSTGVIVAENNRFFLYSPSDGQHAAWEGVEKGMGVGLTFDEDKEMMLFYFQEDITVEEDTSDYLR